MEVKFLKPISSKNLSEVAERPHAASVGEMALKHLDSLFTVNFLIRNIFLQFLCMMSSRNKPYNSVVLSLPTFAVNFFDTEVGGLTL